MDRSPKMFREFSDKYVHMFQQESDTGIKMNLLQNYIFIPLDIFRKNVQYKGIENKLDAWLTFLSTDEPEQIIRLITEYPEFKAMYEHVYNMCRNVEDVMGIFSEELKILDRNTVKYMVDEMQETIDEQKKQLKTSAETIDEQKKQLKMSENTIDTQKSKIDELQEQIELLQKQLKEK